MFDRMNGIGAHEVIIETPDHTASLGGLAGEAGGRRAVGVPESHARSEAGSPACVTRCCSRITAKRRGRRWSTRTPN